MDYIDILDKEAFDQSWKGEDGTVEDYTQATAPDGTTYYICRRKVLSSAVQGVTHFAYPKMHIENILIPNLIKMRNELLQVKTPTFGETEAQAKASS